MKTFNLRFFKLKVASFFILAGIMAILASCEKDDIFATINILEPQNKSGDVRGNGGTTTKTWSFENSNTTAGWDMSIDAQSGSFQFVIKDAAGTTVLDRTLTAGQNAQDASGTSSAGTAGTWTVTATLTNFNGSGDYSFL
ncbi:hypothetical protein [Confluentibacter flavum]|nr:hypothetical protein [Confluentibacter flavum]